MPSNSQPTSPVRVGVIGGGQLARMMGEAAESVNVELHVLATSKDDCAVTTCHEASVGDAKDASALAKFAASVDVVTFDHELVDLDQIAELEKSGVVVRPSS
ncbi:MAG: hypothetical protein WCG18_05810, partial [Acidimicrobiaceae bacterium]